MQRLPPYHRSRTRSTRRRGGGGGEGAERGYSRGTFRGGTSIRARPVGSRGAPGCKGASHSALVEAASVACELLPARQVVAGEPA